MVQVTNLLYGMLLIARIVIAIGLLIPFVAGASESELSPDEAAAINQASAWVKAADPDSLTAKWPYHFGSPAACKPHFATLLELPSTHVADGEEIVLEHAQYEGWWLYSDLENGRFWIAKTEGYFGTAHFYGPARLTDSGSLELISESEVEISCES